MFELELLSRLVQLVAAFQVLPSQHPNRFVLDLRIFIFQISVNDQKSSLPVHAVVAAAAVVVANCSTLGTSSSPSSSSNSLDS